MCPPWPKGTELRLMGVILQVYRAATVTRSLRLTQLCSCFEWKKLQAETTAHYDPLGYTSRKKIHIDRKQVCTKRVHLYRSVCESGN